MNIRLELYYRKLFGLVKIKIRGDLELKVDGGQFIKGRVRKTVIQKISQSGATGEFSVDGEWFSL